MYFACENTAKIYFIIIYSYQINGIYETVLCFHLILCRFHYS